MVTSQDLAHRRWFVSQGLNGHLPEDSIRTAVRICDEEFARDPAFSLVKFLDRLGTIDRNAADKRPALFVSLQRARLKPFADVLPESQRRAATPTVANVRSPELSMPSVATGPAGWQDVFNVTMATLFAKLRLIKSATATEAAQHLIEYLEQQTLSLNTIDEVQRCLRRQEMLFTSKVSKREMHLILHCLYLWSCETLGPVVTDKLFSASLEEAGKHPSAVSFPPHALM